MEPLRRSRRGSITPVTKWRLYADHGMDPICRSVTAGTKANLFLCKLVLALVLKLVQAASNLLISAKVASTRQNHVNLEC
jgi:hypothetical protein